MVKISVIVPVYKTEEYLDVCLDSLLNQTFGDFEVICVNDGSPDSSLEILRAYSKLDKRIKVYSKKNGGLASARNFGMQYAKGEYITFVDSDDFLSPIALEKMYTNISENKSDFMFAYGFQLFGMSGQIWEMPNKKEFSIHVKDSVFSEKDLNAEFYMKMLCTAWGKLYKRDFIKDFRFSEDVIFEDVPFFANCWVAAKRISYVLEPLYFYRKHSAGTVSHPNEKFIDIFKVNNMVTDIFAKYGKLEKYKTVLLVHQMETSLVRMLEASGAVKREMFNQLKETYGAIDFNAYDMDILKRKNVYYAYQKILSKSYRDFRQFEINLGMKNGK